MRIIITLLLTLLVCACGQKGPLYLPDETSAKPSTQDTLAQDKTGSGATPNKEQYEAQLKTQNPTPND